MTMTLISTVTLTSTSDTINFNSIPQSGTDLLVLVSARSQNSINSGTNDGYRFLPNGQSIGGRRLQVVGSTVTSTIHDSSSSVSGVFVPRELTTAGIFSNDSFLIPNYTRTGAKTISIENAVENNAVAALLLMYAATTLTTGAITSITIQAQTTAGATFSIGTTASLYTITKGSGGATVS